MRKSLSIASLILALLTGMGAMAAAVETASACGTVHLPGCGASGNYC
jgi:hypothetical protein